MDAMDEMERAQEKSAKASAALAAAMDALNSDEITERLWKARQSRGKFIARTNGYEARIARIERWIEAQGS